MNSANLFDVAASILSKNPNSLVKEAWGFGSYAANPEFANDVDILIIFSDDTPSAREHICKYCVSLRQLFHLLTGKDLDISRLTVKEAAEFNFIDVTKAIHIWSNHH